MDWGMKNRMARIIRPDTGRAVMLALDHGYFLGPTHRLEVPEETITPLLPYADTIMLTRGVLRTSVDPGSGANVVLRVSGGTSIAGPHLEDEGLTTDFEEAIRLNVAGVGISVFVGTEFERQTLLGLSELVNQGERYGIPVLGITAVGKELEKRDSRYLALCCRICAELGAHIVKTYYCEDFEKVTRSCPVPIVIAGGPKLDTEMDVFNMTHEAISRGAAGVDMGRNIWQRDNPVAIIRAIRGIVHENMTPKQAHELFTELVQDAGVSERTDKNKARRKTGKIARIAAYVTPLIEQEKYTRKELVSMAEKYFSNIQDFGDIPSLTTIKAQIYRATREDAEYNKFSKVAVEDPETKVMRFSDRKPV